MSLKTIFERILGNQALSDNDRAYVLDWATRAENMPGGTNPVTGQITSQIVGPTQHEIDTMVQQAITSSAGALFPRLSDISRVMGLMRAGEFRTGNDAVPGDGFTGGRFGWPGFSYGATTYFLAGVENDVLQVGLSLADGKIYAGAGAVVLDDSGITTTGATIQSANWVEGASGFRIEGDTGDAEFNNIIARGLIKTAVFEKDTVSSIGGQLLVLDSDALATDMTALDASTLTIAGNTTFAVGDFLRMKDGVSDEWLEVTSIASAPTYAVTRDKAAQYTADNNPAWKRGQAVVNYGSSGNGGIILTGGTSPKLSLFTHAGAPWTTITEGVQLTKSGIAILETSGQGFLSFYDAAGTTHEFALINNNDIFTIISKIVGGRIDVTLKLTDSGTPSLTWREDPDTDNVSQLNIAKGSAGGKLSIDTGFVVSMDEDQAGRAAFGSDHYIDFLDTATGTGSATVYFNERGKDIDVLIKDAANAELFKTDAGAAQVKYKGVAIREVLAANRTYYVRTDGSDSNTGLANTAGGAFLTIQKAYDVACSLDMGGYTVTIQIGDGTYTGGLSIDKPWVGGNLTIQGNSGTPANVVVSTSGNCVTCTIAIPGVFTIKDMKLTSSAASCIEHFSIGVLKFSNLNFGSAASFHISSNTAGGNVQGSSYAITGGAAIHWASIGGGTVECKNITITLTGTPAFSFKFAVVTQGLGNIRCEGNTFSGSATGTRYLAEQNGVIFTNGGGANYLPGDAAGSTATGGQYV
jgi:hypothetical protein